jgi:hypothetical protein
MQARCFPGGTGRLVWPLSSARKLHRNLLSCAYPPETQELRVFAVENGPKARARAREVSR